MNALQAFSIIALVGLIVVCVLTSVLVFKTIPGLFVTLERMQDRHSAHLDKTLDRLMTIKWESYVAVQELQTEPEEGGFFAPEEQAEPERQPETRWGHLSALKDHFEQEEHEDQLIREDFAT